jgi:hypothetical protein
MKFGSHRHERLKLPQFHKLTVRPKTRAAQEGVSAGHALLFGSTEESMSELPLDPRSAPCQGAQANVDRQRPGTSLVRDGPIRQTGCLAARDEMVPDHQPDDQRMSHGRFRILQLSRAMP